MRVQVLFLQDVPPRYLAGEIREVTAGYARNYLIPRELAVLATKAQMNRIATIKRAAEERRQVQTLQMSELAARLTGVSVTIQARAGEGGRLYGSITNMALAEALQKELGVAVDRRLIHLPEPIRALGSFQVPVRLSKELTPTITVNVESAAAGGTGEQPPSPQAEETAKVTSVGEPTGEADVRREDASP